MSRISATRIAVLSVLVCFACGPSGGATQTLPAAGLTIRADWQFPEYLPPQFRNHCTYENFTGRPYCSDHCGSDYQFYYCSELSFGCCHLGHGYCDLSGYLRCHP